MKTSLLASRAGRVRKRLSKGTLVMFIVMGAALLLMGYALARLYIQTDLDRATSAKPEARRLVSAIKKDGGTIIHSYNRSTGGSLNKVSTPSYEYYVEFQGAELERHIGALRDALKGLGYRAETARFVAKEYFCTKYGYRTKGDEADAAGRERCKQLIGVDNPELFGSLTDDEEPYYTLYAENDGYEVWAQISDKYFHSTANDFWSRSYAKRHNLGLGIVPGGRSIMSIDVTRLTPEE